MSATDFNVMIDQNLAKQFIKAKTIEFHSFIKHFYSVNLDIPEFNGDMVEQFQHMLFAHNCYLSPPLFVEFIQNNTDSLKQLINSSRSEAISNAVTDDNLEIVKALIAANATILTDMQFSNSEIQHILDECATPSTACLELVCFW